MYIFLAPRKYVRKADARRDFKVTRGVLAVAAFVLGIVIPIPLAMLSRMRLSELPSSEIPLLIKYSPFVFGVLASLGLFVVVFVLSDKHRQRFEANLKSFDKVPDSEMLVRTDLYGRMLYMTISMVVACVIANVLFVTYVFSTIDRLLS